VPLHDVKVGLCCAVSSTGTTAPVFLWDHNFTF